MSDRSRPGEVSKTAIARAIDEALAGVAAAPRAAEIVGSALSAAGVRELPEGSAMLRPVVRALVAEVERMLGADAAHLVEGELESLLRVLARVEAIADDGKPSSGSLPRELHRASTVPAIAPELVLVLTHAPELASRLRHLLGAATRVEAASTAAGLRFQMLRARPVRPVIVIDARIAIAGATGGPSPARAEGATALVVWGDHATVEAWAWIAPDRVVRCTDEVELVDLACLLRTSLAKVA